MIFTAHSKYTNIQIMKLLIGKLPKGLKILRELSEDTVLNTGKLDCKRRSKWDFLHLTLAKCNNELL